MIQESLLDWQPPEPRGTTYDKARDGARLNAQCLGCLRIWQDGRKRSLAEMRQLTGYPEASISARYRDLKRAGYPMRKEHIGNGLWLYWMQINDRGEMAA